MEQNSKLACFFQCAVLLASFFVFVGECKSQQIPAGKKVCEARPGCSRLIDDTATCSPERALVVGGSCPNGLLDGFVTRYNADGAVARVFEFQNGVQIPGYYFQIQRSAVGDGYALVAPRKGEGESFSCNIDASGAIIDALLGDTTKCRMAIRATNGVPVPGVYPLGSTPQLLTGISASGAAPASGVAPTSSVSALPVQPLNIAGVEDGRADACISFRFDTKQKGKLLSVNSCPHPVMVIGRVCAQSYAKSGFRTYERGAIPVGSLVEVSVPGPTSGQIAGVYSQPANSDRSVSGNYFANTGEGDWSKTPGKIHQIVFAAFKPPYVTERENHSTGPLPPFYPIAERVQRFDDALKARGWSFAHTYSIGNGELLPCANVDFQTIWNATR